MWGRATRPSRPGTASIHEANHGIPRLYRLRNTSKIRLKS
jgi:hypothetical protein